MKESQNGEVFIMVYSAGSLLAAGACGFGALPGRLAAVAAVSRGRHRSGRSAGVGQRDYLSASPGVAGNLRTARPAKSPVRKCEGPEAPGTHQQ